MGLRLRWIWARMREKEGVPLSTPLSWKIMSHHLMLLLVGQDGAVQCEERQTRHGIHVPLLDFHSVVALTDMLDSQMASALNLNKTQESLVVGR